MTLQNALYLPAPVYVDPVRHRRVVLAQLEEDELLLESRVWPHLLASYVIGE